MRKFKRYLETPRDRKERKAREYRLSVLRTIFGGIGSFCAVLSLVISVAIFIRVLAR